MRTSHGSCFQFMLPLLFVAVMGTAVMGGEFPASSTSEAKLTRAKIRASLFLQRTTFGPTEVDVNDLADRIVAIGLRRACNEWIDDQFDPSLHPTPITPEFADIGNATDLETLSHQGLAQHMIFQDYGNADSTLDGESIQRYRYHAWWHKAIRGEDQLRQRVGWALSQILVTSIDGAGFEDRNPGNGTTDGGDPAEEYPIGRWLGLSNYYDTLVKHSFGNYKDLLEEVTYHPIMGVYLSHMRNRKAPPDNSRSPDENYAREIMQLFSIGLYELHEDGRLEETASGDLIPTYDNETIKAFARVFTGLTFKPNATNNWSEFQSGNDFTFPMQMHAPEHDTDPKVVFPGKANETTIDADSQTSFANTVPAYGDYEVKKAVDVLFNHDNVGPFIAYRLIQRLVKSNPSRAYIRRVAEKFNDDGNGRGNMKSVIKAIFLDPEAFRSIRVRVVRNPSRVVVQPRGTEYSRLQEPVVRYTNFLRATKIETTDDPFGRFMAGTSDQYWQQEPYRSPSVFNFFLPGYQPSGDLIGFQPTRRIPNGNLVAPEFQQLTSVTSNYLQQKYQSDISDQTVTYYYNGGPHDFYLDLSDEEALIDADVGIADATTRNEALRANLLKVIDKYDLLLCTGTMPQDFKEEMAIRIRDGIQWMPTNTNTSSSGQPWNERTGEFGAESALLSVLVSPFCAIAE